MIAYISWNYGRGPKGRVHLVRFKDGRGVLITTAQAITHGLLK